MHKVVLITGDYNLSYGGIQKVLGIMEPLVDVSLDVLVQNIKIRRNRRLHDMIENS